MKKFFFLVALFCIFMPIVNAVSYVGTVTGTGVYIRKGPGTGYDSIKKSSLGVIYDMPDDTLVKDEGNGCSNGWYKVYYEENDNSKIGYMCSDYLSVNVKVEEEKPPVVDPTGECQKQMKSAGFPASYWDSLCELKKKHPKWDFKAISKDADGNTVSLTAAIKAELNNCSNTISKSAKAEFIRGDSTCTNSLDSGYTRASEAAIKYYMDPRNFLTEKYIFMFESQYYNKNIDSALYSKATSKIFNNNYMVQQITYVPELIVNGAQASGLSQTAIASRIKQELGSAKLSYEYDYDHSALYSVVSGNYTSRTGYYYNPDTGKFVKDSKYKSINHYYNWYNIAATDGSGVTQKALAYAYKKGWGGTGNVKNDRQSSLSLGAKWIYDKYTNVGQQTIYFNKFNTFPTKSSSRYIHQYMTNIQAPVSESTILYNAYNGVGMLDAPFIFYIPVYNDIGYISVETGEKQEDTTKVSVGSAVKSAGYTMSGSTIMGIKLGTKTSTIKSNLESKGVEVIITDAEGKSAGSTIGTGYKITVNGATQEVLTVVIYGDVSGDGEINALDLLKVQKHILGISTLKGAYKTAADPSKDNNINALDLLKVQKHILKISSITQ